MIIKHTLEIHYKKDRLYVQEYITMWLDGVLKLATFSLSVSRAEVASSKSRILGFLTMARAMAMRCFCPLDSWEP